MGKGVMKSMKEHRNHLALVLQDQGYTYEEANYLVKSVFGLIKAALKRHEEVELPIGTLKVVEVPQREKRRWVHNRPQTVFRRRYRVVFQPFGGISG